MLSRLQYLVEDFFESSATIFYRARFTPNITTSIGFILTLGSAFFYYEKLSLASSWLAAWILLMVAGYFDAIDGAMARRFQMRSEEHTSELQSRPHLVCRLLLEKKKKQIPPLSNLV